MIKGLVSIVIPCYNSEKYIGDCLNAILNQTYRKLEIIVVNDGSTDRTYEILKSYEKEFYKAGIKFNIICQENAGQASAINNGLKYAVGEFLSWQDSDDCYTEDGIKLMIEYLESHKDIQFVRGEVAKMDERMLKLIEHGKSKYPNAQNIFDFYVFETDSYCWPGIFMVRMEYFDECIKDREIYVSRAGQNWALILPIAYKGKCGYVDKVVYKYRIRENSYYNSIKGISNLIKREDEHKEVLLCILNRIDMDKKERVEYIKKIDYKYRKFKTIIYVINCWELENCEEILQLFFSKNNINTVAIYGMGNLGKKLLKKMRNLDVKVAYAIDKNADNLNIKGLKIIDPREELEKVDTIIITPLNFKDEIIQTLVQKGIHNVVTLEEILNCYLEQMGNV